MLYILMLFLLSLCIIDLSKNKKIFSLRFVFNFIWFIVLFLYQFKLSYIQQTLSNKTLLVLFVCVLSYNITLTILKLFKLKEIKLNFNFGKTNIKLNFAKYIVVLVLIIEIIYSKGFPLLWKLIGSGKTYFDYGIPSLHGAFCGLVICLGAYSIYKKKKDKYFYFLIGVLLISRQILMSMIIEWLVLALFNKSMKQILKKIVVVSIVCIIGFNIIGNMRSGNSVMNDVFQAKPEYKYLPTSIKWVYSYMTFSLSNFNNLVSMSDGNVNKGTSMLNELLPTVVLNKLNLKHNYSPNFLVSQNYNVSTYLPSIYLDFGIIGISIFNILIAILGYILYNNLLLNRNEKNLLLYSVFIHNIVFLFFINMFLYLPIIIQFVYIIILFNEKQEKEITINENNNSKIAILMATYNGENYLKEQIESILNQTYKNFTLFIRDDNSTDDTKKIIQEYHDKYPTKIVEVIDGQKAGGACKNFMILLKYVYNLKEYDLFMFSDQDDIWLENKVYLTIEKYNEQKNKDIPILVHTDLLVVDNNLNLIDNSFINYSNLNYKKNKFNNYLIQNNVTGCTTLVNRQLVELIKFKSYNSICMHDWYFALIASAFGKVVFIDKPTIKYRQHANNVLGAKKIKGISGIYNKLVKNNTIENDLKKVLNQAQFFKKVYYKNLNNKNKKILSDFCELKKSNKLKKFALIIKNSFYKHGLIRILGEFIYI